MNSVTKLSIGLAIAIGIGACNKKDATDKAAPKPTDNPSAKTEPSKPAEPPKPAPPKPMTGAELAEQYKTCGQMLNDKKLDDFIKGCVADDYKSHQGAMEMKGDQLKGMFSAMQTAFPDMKFAPQIILVSGRNVFAIAYETGTSEGTMKMPPMPDIPATHKKITDLFFHRLQFDDTNKVNEEWGFEDMGTFMFQMGLTPKDAPPHRTADDIKPLDGAPIVAVAADDAKEKANIEATKKGMDAFNTRKNVDLLASYADDAVESDVTSPKDAKGKKEIENGLKQFQTAFSDSKITADNVWAAGDYTVTTGMFEGTNDHDMGKMKKTGKHVSIPFAEITQFKDGKITHLWRFHDSMTMAMQLGLVPAMGAPPTGDKAPKTDATPKK